MKQRYKKFTMIALISSIFILSLFVNSSSAYQYTTYRNDDIKLIHWADWNRNNIGLLTNGIAKLQFEGYAPGSVFYCWTPYFYNSSSGNLEKTMWLSNVKPVKCVWEYYDPTMHLFYKVEKTPAIIYQGDFHGYKYAFADHNEFTIPALFFNSRYGDWYVRTYFVFEDGSTGGEGPVVDENGNSYLLQFPVVKGSFFDLIFTAPIYILGVKTIPLFWWLSPIWIFLIFFIILVIYTHSVVGAVKAIKSAVKATKEAKKEWRKP